MIMTTIQDELSNAKGDVQMSVSDVNLAPGARTRFALKSGVQEITIERSSLSSRLVSRFLVTPTLMLRRLQRDFAVDDGKS